MIVVEEIFAAFARRRQGMQWGFPRCETRPKILGRRRILLVRYFESVLEMIGR